jgi:hypothetical protein
MAIHLAFDLSRDRFQRFQSSVLSQRTQGSILVGFCCAKIAVIVCEKSSLTLSPDHFCRLAIRNDSSEMTLSRLHSSVHALGDEIQDSYQRRE